MNKWEKARAEYEKRFSIILEHYAQELLDRDVMQYLTRHYMTDMGISILKMEKAGRITGIRPSEFFSDIATSEPPDFVPDRWRASDRFKPDDRITLCLGPDYFETSGGREIRPARALPLL